MIKLMIVDDEAIFREYMRTSFDFENYGFTICCEAKNGREALEMMAKHEPDVVLTDINMPHLDGLSLSEKLLEQNPDLGIVLISGHSEFDYAKRAVKIGVSDYILKPFEKEELMLTLLKLKDHLYQTVESDKLSEKNPLKASLMSALLNLEITPDDDLMNRLKSEGLGKVSDRYIVAALAIDNIDVRWHDLEEKMLWRFAVMNILDEHMALHAHHHSFYDFEGNIISLLEVPRDVTDYDDSYLGHLKTLINTYLGFTVTLGIGTVHEGIPGIRTSYQEAISALGRKFMLGTNRAIHYEAHPSGNQDISFYTAVTHRQLLVHLGKMDKAGCGQLLSEIFAQIHARGLQEDYSSIIYMSMMSILLSHIAQSGKSVDDVLGPDFSLETYLNKRATCKEWEARILALYEGVIDHQKNHKPSRSATVAAKAMAYIQAHYHLSGLTVKDIASDQYINQTYLRSMFKAEVGTTVSDYITTLRLENAKALLGERKYRLADIAERVGYADASYFSKSFKKYYGLSPSQYEKSLG